MTLPPGNQTPSGPRRILLTGASGFIGRALRPVLEASGAEVIPLRREAAGHGRTSGAIWDIAAGRVDLSGAGRLDAVVHLAGETVAQRWTRAARQRIRDSRVRGTRLLCDALATMPEPPQTLVAASAIGYYGQDGDRWLDEASPAGTGFLAEVTRNWEESASAARARGIRVIHLRLGIVLACNGGALSKMLTPFRLGLGGRVGDGRQYWSWVTLPDVVRCMDWAVRTPGLQGIFNVVAPHAVTNAEFTAALGRVLKRPTVVAAPAWAVKLLLGEMGRETLLGSARVKPARLIEAGFAFRHPELEPALRELLGGEPGPEL